MIKIYKRQICVWEGTIFNDEGRAPTAEEIKNFENFMLAETGCHIKYLETVITLPDRDENNNLVPETGGRHDVFVTVRDKDLPKFAMKRMLYGIKWWEDVLGHGNGVIYPQEVLNRYPVT